MIGRMSPSGVSLAVLILSATLAWASQAKEQAAVLQAERWLSAVDAGRYAETWDTAAELFKNAVSKEQWVGSMNAYRKPLGRLMRRELKGKKYVTSLPGAPDGQYVVIQYATAYENKQAAVETITPMLGADGAWRVSGYFIK